MERGNHYAVIYEGIEEQAGKLQTNLQSSKTRRHAWCVSSHQYSTLSSSYDHDDSLTESSPEDVFMFDDRLTPPRESSQLGVTGVGQVTKNCRETSLQRQRFKHPTLRSLSLDSAVDNDSGIIVAPVSGQQADLQYNLTSVKLALTQALEREALLQSRLDQKETQCFDNEEKVRWLQSCQGSRGETRVLEEKLRVLRRENEFLDEEVRQLVDVQRQQKLLHKDQQRKINDMEMEIEKRKLDYVFLLQSLITMPTGDPHDGLEVKLFGGTAHRESIEKLLEEARTTNPALPNYHRLSRDGVHTDCYGFKHHFRNEGLLLHYLCQHLVVHYTRRLASSRENETKWHRVLRSKFLVRTSVLKTLCRGGIPHHLRPAVWQKLVHTQVADIMAAKGDRYFSHLVNMTQDSQYVSRYRKQISLDLLRTMPENFNYSDANSDGIQSMTMVLQAFCIHNPVLGYCQGMNFIVAFFLLFLNTEDSFWALVAIMERFFAVNYFDHNLSGAQADQDVLKDLMKEKLPYLHRHFSRLHVDISSITLNWFLTLFINAVPFLNSRYLVQIFHDMHDNIVHKTVSVRSLISLSNNHFTKTDSVALNPYTIPN
ncbi:TBC1 domain family member 2B [Lamellibrachia satsuma]|nr:TBC1 domain family member 2B [Lamellibrachia satsuma]